MGEEKEQEKETPKESLRDPTGQVREKLESEGLDHDELDEDEREELADLL